MYRYSQTYLLHYNRTCHYTPRYQRRYSQKYRYSRRSQLHYNRTCHYNSTRHCNQNSQKLQLNQQCHYNLNNLTVRPAL